MEPPDRYPVLLPLFDQLVLCVGAETHRTPEPPQCLVIRGHNMRALHPVELQPVFHRPQESVGGRQRCRIFASDVPPRGHRLERTHRVCAAQHHIGTTVDQLQHLHTELHIAQSALAKLEFPVRLVDRDIGLNPAAHLLHLADEVGAVRRRPHQRRQRLNILASKFSVPRREARLE